MRLHYKGIDIWNPPFKWSWVKEYFSLIIGVPTLLGGLWQLLELVAIGSPYIRFFSITQLIPDGILLLFCLVVVYFVLRLLMNDVVIVGNDEKEASGNGLKNHVWIKIRQGIGGVILVAIGVGIGYATLPDLFSYSNMTIDSPLVQFVMLLFYLYLSLILVMYGAVEISNSFNFKWKRYKNSLRNFTGFTIVLFSIFGSITLVSAFHRYFAMPENLKNRQYLQCRVKKANPNTKAISIRYFNDKFIFVDIQVDSVKHVIEVFPFEDFSSWRSCED